MWYDCRGAARAGTKLNVTDITLMAVQQTLQELRKFIDRFEQSPMLSDYGKELIFSRVATHNWFLRRQKLISLEFRLPEKK